MKHRAGLRQLAETPKASGGKSNDGHTEQETRTAEEFSMPNGQITNQTILDTGMTNV